ncbi:iron hydrogenase [Patescibacteria group bacterium]|nr:iron hydrogenase [Patescibacteria group bacterium]
MKKVKSIVLDLVQKKVLAKTSLFAIFLVLAIFAPLLKQQFVTGSIVNALLFLSTTYLGITAGLLISFLPSIFSLFTGLLPLPLIPMIPFIIVSNAILVLSFNFLRKKSFGFSIVLASLLKFLFLFGTSSFIINFFIKQNLPEKIIMMMAWPQLITALMGGLITFIILKVSKA